LAGRRRPRLRVPRPDRALLGDDLQSRQQPPPQRGRAVRLLAPGRDRRQGGAGARDGRPGLVDRGAPLAVALGLCLGSSGRVLRAAHLGGRLRSVWRPVPRRGLGGVPSPGSVRTVDAALSIEGVTKRYGSTVALDQVSFRVRPGSCHGLVGPNGAGKTTTFALAAGFLRPGTGTVRILGRDPHDRGASRPRLGVLPQDADLPGWLHRGTLLTTWAQLSGEARPEAAARVALARVQLPEAWDASPR